MATGAVVSGLVIGLPAYVLIKVMVPGFFARKDTRTPVYTAGAALLVNIGLNFLLVPRLGVVGLAISGSISAWCNTALLYVMLSKRGFYHLTRLSLWRIARIIAAAAFMGAVLWYAMPYGTGLYAGETLERIGAVAALVALGGVAFVLAAFVLRVLDRRTIDQLMRRPA